MFMFDHDNFSPCHVALLMDSNQTGSGLYELVEGRQFEHALNRLQNCPKEARYRQHGWTPLHLLCWIMHDQEEGQVAGQGSSDGSRGVDSDANNINALDETQIQQLPQILALAEALLDAYPSAVWDDGMGGETPLDVAVIHGSVPLLALLIDKHPSCMDPASVNYIPAWERAWRHLVGRTLRHRLARQRAQQLLMQQQQDELADDDVGDVTQTTANVISSEESDSVISSEESDTMELFLLDLKGLMTSKSKGSATSFDPSSNAEQALLCRIWDNLSFLLCQASSKLGCGCVKDKDSRDGGGSAWSLVFACLTVGCCAPDLFRFAIMMSSHPDRHGNHGNEHGAPLDQESFLNNVTGSTDADGNTPLHLLICSQKRCPLRANATWGVRASTFSHVEFLLQYTNGNTGTDMPFLLDEEEQSSSATSRRRRRLRCCHDKNHENKMTSITNNKGELALHMALKRSDHNWWQTRITTASAMSTSIINNTNKSELESPAVTTVLGEGHATTRALLAADPWTGSIADGDTGHLPFVLAALNMRQADKIINPQDSSSNNRSSAEDELNKDATRSAHVETLFQLLGACPDLQCSRMIDTQ